MAGRGMERYWSLLEASSVKSCSIQRKKLPEIARETRRGAEGRESKIILPDAPLQLIDYMEPF